MAAKLLVPFCPDMFFPFYIILLAYRFTLCSVTQGTLIPGDMCRSQEGTVMQNICRYMYVLRVVSPHLISPMILFYVFVLRSDLIFMLLFNPTSSCGLMFFLILIPN